MDKDYSMYKLKLRQALDLEEKILLSKRRIREWYDYYNGEVYVSFSGGKDSTVLLHLVRSLYPDVKGVFADTGLEYPEIREFVKTIDNVTWVKPKKTFKEVLTNKGFPIISKQVSMGISRYRGTKSLLQKKLRMNGGINPSSGKKQQPSIPKKWAYMVDAPFKISEKCCDFMKKEPLVTYEKKNDVHPYIGVMAEESTIRNQNYSMFGCNAFDLKKPQSRPMMFWKEEDVWGYIKIHDVPYSKIYDMGEKRTGCMFCMFGVHLEKGENRFQRMYTTHPKQWNYCMENLGLLEVLSYMGIKTKPVEVLEDEFGF